MSYRNKLKEVPYTSRYDYLEDKKVWDTKKKWRLANHDKDRGVELIEGSDAANPFTWVPAVLHPNEPFTSTLHLKDYYRGESAFGIVLVDDHGTFYKVFMVDAMKIIPKMVNGTITAKFIVRKRGIYYGLTLYE